MVKKPSLVNARLPGFLLVGAAKSATSSLHYYLDQHPQIKMPSQKESWFFSFYKNPVAYSSPGGLSDLVSELDDYLHLFDGATSDQLLGDACPSYLYTYKDTIKNIRALYSAADLEKLKIIISLREPVSRAHSQYYTFKRKVEEPLCFAEAVREETVKQRLHDNWNIFYDYLGFGLYSKQVEAFQQEFGKERVMVVLYDDIRDDTPAVCRSLYAFLGVDADFVVNDKEKHNSFVGEPKLQWLVAGLFSKNRLKRQLSRLIPRPVRMVILYIIIKPLLKRSKLDETTQQYLSEYFRQDILKLEKIIGRDLSAWQDKS